MTQYIAAYDAENDACADALERIVAVHEKHQTPATFFTVSGLLDRYGDIYRRLLGDNPLFEIGSHTATHGLVLEHPLGPEPASGDQLRTEIVDSRKRLQDFFGQPVNGFRTPYGYVDGLCGATHVLDLVREAGYTYVSSAAWGQDFSLPAPVREAFRYDEDGFPELWEVPPCGWHENLLKNHNALGPIRLLLYPAPIPEAQIADYVKTPEEEFNVHRVFIDHAVKQGAGHVSLIWHPWSLHRFDPEMTMVDMTFQCVRELGLPVGTFQDRVDALNGVNQGGQPA
jgi:hypothetical protein